MRSIPILNDRMVAKTRKNGQLPRISNITRLFTIEGLFKIERTIIAEITVCAILAGMPNWV